MPPFWTCRKTSGGNYTRKCRAKTASARWRLIGINSSDGVNFTGGFENGNGFIKNGALRGDRIEFDRENGWKQHFSGQLVNDGGKLKIVNGVWTGYYQEHCPGRNNWHAEKR